MTYPNYKIFTKKSIHKKLKIKKKMETLRKNKCRIKMIFHTTVYINNVYTRTNTR